ncbi:MAG TPA: BON domain-containing protein, partial [Candidatus Acidoferrum sp.]|nr:BON domain-containing protein [Candidatus Acidoferrum sp.]
MEVAPGVPASFITVGVTNEVVTLNGAVDNLLARKRAEAIAATTPGVSAVHNQIVILPAERNDWEVRAGVADALSVAPALKNDKIDPEVRDGFVTLTGKV